ncbi:Zn-dependent exopeptidase, partial [Ceratobasidium sp. AG-I]
MAATSFDKANRSEKAYGACGGLASVQTLVLDHKCTNSFCCDRVDKPHGGLRYSSSINVLNSSNSPRRLFLSLTMFTVLAIGSFALASFAAGVVVPAGVRPLNADARLLKFGPGDNQAEWVSTAAIALLRESHAVDLTKGTDALRAAHPELTGVSDAIINRLGNHTLRGPGFLDITGMEFVRREIHSDLEARATYPTPTPSKYPALTTYFNAITASGLSSTVSTLSAYTTRYYKSANAAAASTWIQTQFSSAAGSANVKTIANTFSQPNVIATIPAKSGSTLTDVIILGAHIDSTVGGSTTARAPGADDDASGIAILLQTLQILKSNGWSGSRPIEFHAYGGEEGGMLGSATVAKSYKSAGRTVRAMLQFDMVAYQPTSKPVLTVLTDTDASLQSFSQSLISAYVPEASLYTNKCGYACSDHFSWYNQGYASVSIDESGPSDTYLNPYYHTASDTIDKLDFTKASKFVKLALAFILELSE